MPDNEPTLQQQRISTLESLNKIAGKIKRNLTELALSCDIDPDLIDQEAQNAQVEGILSVQNYTDLKNKLIAWISRESTKLNQLATEVQNIQLPGG